MDDKEHTRCLLSNTVYLSLRNWQRIQSSADQQEEKKEAEEVYANVVENQDTLDRRNQDVERLRCGYDDVDTRIKEEIERMWYESLEDKGCLVEGFWLMLRYMFH